MIEFTCPKCGKRVPSDDLIVGQLLTCPHCQATFLAKPDAVPATAPPPSKRGSSIWPTLLRLTAILAVGGTLVSLLVVYLMNVRESAARTQSVNNLKQIALAMQSFHDAYHRLPTNGVKEDVPNPGEGPVARASSIQGGSWAFKLLPYVETEPKLASTITDHTYVPAYLCPGRGRPPYCTTGPWTDYMINPFINSPVGSVDAPDTKRQLEAIRTGTSHTIFAGHGMINPDWYAKNVAHAQSTDIFKSGDPALARQSTKNQRDTNEDHGLTWGSPFSRGAAMAMCDGTVRFFSYDITGGTIQDGWADDGLAIFLTSRGNNRRDLPD